MAGYLPAVGGESLDLNLSPTTLKGSVSTSRYTDPVSVPVVDDKTSQTGGFAAAGANAVGAGGEFGQKLFREGGKSAGMSGMKYHWEMGWIPSDINSRSEYKKYKKSLAGDGTFARQIQESSMKKWGEKTAGKSFFTDKEATQAYPRSGFVGGDFSNIPAQGRTGPVTAPTSDAPSGDSGGGDSERVKIINMGGGVGQAPSMPIPAIGGQKLDTGGMMTGEISPTLIGGVQMDALTGGVSQTSGAGTVGTTGGTQGRQTLTGGVSGGEAPIEQPPQQQTPQKLDFEAYLPQQILPGAQQHFLPYEPIQMQDIQRTPLPAMQQTDIQGLNIPAYNPSQPYQAPQVYQQPQQLQLPFGFGQQESITQAPAIQAYSPISGPTRIRF